MLTCNISCLIFTYNGSYVIIYLLITEQTEGFQNILCVMAAHHLPMMRIQAMAGYLIFNRTPPVAFGSNLLTALTICTQLTCMVSALLKPASTPTPTMAWLIHILHTPVYWVMAMPGVCFLLHVLTSVDMDAYSTTDY